MQTQNQLNEDTSSYEFSGINTNNKQILKAISVQNEINQGDFLALEVQKITNPRKIFGKKRGTKQVQV